jgi:hypothetical protein
MGCRYLLGVIEQVDFVATILHKSGNNLVLDQTKRLIDGKRFYNCVYLFLYR